MLEELFNKASSLKRKIEEYESEKARFKEILERARELWTPYTPRPNSSHILAVDSGWNCRLYTGFYVYAIQSAAVDEEMRIYHPIVEVDLLSGDPYEAGLTPENFLKYRSEIYEHMISYEAMDEADLILVDGSLTARLMDVYKRLSPRLQVEYMANVRPLRNKEKLAFISKYSHDKHLFGGFLGDVYYINHAVRRAGYVMVPEIVERDGIEFTIFYVRLVDYADALHVEVPAKVDQEYVEQFMGILCHRNVLGYPYSLQLAHKVSRIPDRLMDQVCKTAGLIGFTLARKVLSI